MIRKFENFNTTDPDITYAIYTFDENDPNFEYAVILKEDDSIYNPFDINDMAELFVKYCQKYPNENFILKKVITETVDEDTIRKINNKVIKKFFIKKDANKYNL